MSKNPGNAQDQMKHLISAVKSDILGGNIDAISRLAHHGFDMMNSIYIENDNYDYDLVGIKIDWDGVPHQFKLDRGQRTKFENFSFITLSLEDTDDGVTQITLTNNAHDVAYYDITLMKPGNLGEPRKGIPQQFLNPHHGAKEEYLLKGRDRLMIVPQNLASFAALHDPGLLTFQV